MIDLVQRFGCGCGDELIDADAPKDYVVSAESTRLFKAIETQNWDSAIAIVRQNPAEAKKWVAKKGLGGIGSWKRLPIHEACIHKPNEALITALLEANPTGAREKDTDGQLPLHHAVENGASVAVLEQLLLTCPDALDVKNKWGNYPEDIAKSTASQEVIDVLKKRPSLYAVQAYKKVRTLEEDKMKDEFSKQLQDERLRGINAVKEARANELRKSQISINEMNEKLSEVAAERDAAHEKISKLKGVLTATESAVTNLKSTNSQICAEKKAADEKVIELNGTLSAEKDAANKKISKLKEVLSSTEGVMANLKSTNSKIYAEKKAADERVVELNGIVTKLEEDVDNWKYAVTQARAELKKSQAAIDETTQSYLKATAEKDAANKKISKLNANLSAKEDSVKNWMEANSKISAEKKAVEKKVVELNTSIDQLEKKHEKLWVERRKISAKNSSLEKQLESLTLERKSLVDENKAYKSKVDKMLVMFQG